MENEREFIINNKSVIDDIGFFMLDYMNMKDEDFNAFIKCFCGFCAKNNQPMEVLIQSIGFTKEQANKQGYQKQMKWFNILEACETRNMAIFLLGQIKEAICVLANNHFNNQVINVALLNLVIINLCDILEKLKNKKIAIVPTASDIDKLLNNEKDIIEYLKTRRDKIIAHFEIDNFVKIKRNFNIDPPLDSYIVLTNKLLALLRVASIAPIN